MHFIKSVISFVLAVGGIYGLNILSFSGGGAFGAVEIGIIKKLQSESNTNTKYDIYTGISSGGINAGYLSHFNDLNMGIEGAEQLYSNSKNPMVYSFLPFTKVSLLNTSPFKDTLNNVISPLSKPCIPTYIGATNLYSGNLDIFRYDLLETVEEKVNLLMSTSAIPILFPPINFNGTQYTDGEFYKMIFLTLYATTPT
jgi:predicted acylesterase/phospholipase RssA